MVLCKAYNDRSSRGGPGSSGVPSRCAPASPPARKRKAAGGVEHRRPEAPAKPRRRKLLLADDEEDDDTSFAEILESEMLRCLETESAPAGGEPAAMPPCSAQLEEADDVMEISLDEFLGSSAAGGTAPPCTSQPESAAAASCVKTSPQHGQSTGGDMVELGPEKKSLMGASAAPSEHSGGTPSALLTDDDEEEGMCGLACPPMDEDYVEHMLSQPLVQFDPTLIEEYISDL